MYKVGLKFNTASYINDFTSEDTRESIVNNIRTAFNDKDTYNILESKHNLIVEYLKYNEIYKCKTLLRIVFSETNSIVAIYLFSTEALGLEKLRIGSKEFECRDIKDFIMGQKNSEVISYCPYTNERVNTELLMRETDTKMCDTEEINCKNCLRRSSAYVCADLKRQKLYIEHSIEKYSNLFLRDINIKFTVDTLYGYNRGLNELDIADVKHTVDLNLMI